MPCCAVAAYSSYVWVRLEQMVSPAMSDVTAAMLLAVVECVVCRDYSCSRRLLNELVLLSTSCG
jgi:hypothetical protein